MVSDIGVGTLLFDDAMIDGEVEAEFFNLNPEVLSFVLQQFTSAPLVVALGNVHVAIEWTYRYTKRTLPPLPPFIPVLMSETFAPGLQYPMSGH